MQKSCLGWIPGAVLSAALGVHVYAASGDAYTWPGYRSDLDYDTKSNLGDIQPPTKFNNNCSGVTGKKAGKWWAFYWGKDRDSRITDVTIDSILKKYDTDFEYLYNEMGWAPDAQAQEGQYSAVYYYGSGTCAGGAKTDTTGGWQTWVAGYTAVAASFYPLYSFNTSCPYRDRVAQMDAMIHEGIHSMTNGYPGAKDAHWFQEAGNTWIQQDMFSHRDGVYSGMGFLNAATVIAPFMPIETYSGWLIDGTFGGPGGGADGGGVTGKNQRYLLGGSQYSNIFPTFIGTWIGTGAVRWIYGNAYGKTKYLLETYGLDKGLGDAGVRRLITEFRARLAMLDMKKWSGEIKNLLNQHFGSDTYWEQDMWDNNRKSYTWTMTPYQTVTESNGYLVPNQETTPGWSGSNVVPLKVQSGAKEVTVSFYPNGANSNNKNMNFLLCYRATDGTPVYSEPITGEGSATLRLDKTPSSTNGTPMVFAVIVNTDYQYTGNTGIRKLHYDYKLKPEAGVSGAGAANVKYYNDFKLDYKWPEIGDAPTSSSSSITQNSSSSVSPESSSSSEMHASSSSEKPASSSSSAKIVTDGATTYNITATLPIDDNYATVSAKFDISEVAKKLGLTIATLTQAQFFALESDGNIVTNSTAKEPGHWFSKDGKVVEWGETAYVFSEADLANGTFAIGHYPNRVSNGDKFNFTQGLTYNGKTVLFKVTISITNGLGSDESGKTTALMYGLDKVSTHMDIALRNGNLEICYSLPQRDNVKISLFNGFGALLAQEITGMQNAGLHKRSLNMSQIPRGTYIVKITTGSYREARPINITR
ncbi:DUF4859 domain-containing protein [Fibrobacter sp. UWB3]|uniref:DUF4859 domain-containing protein n=1 Tax=Fibrobacter sp. UWB3 TaxID=1964357 RepID=UPI000B5266F4|nr:DUF4859 domain-containing protein [Fibrobacter sp. UWB3]OWV19043.1 hypothetical protein B7991_09195 [Fibrobacter sp. UWB3]